MDKILLVCSSERGTKVYTENLKSMGYVHIDTEGNGGAARRKLIGEEYSIIIIDTPLRDEFGTDLATQIARGQNSVVILIVKAETSDVVTAKVDEYGIFVMPKPFTKSIFNQGIKFAFTSYKRVNVFRNEKDKLLKKVEDIKRIDRAKCLLIQYEKMTEEEAHRYLEKEAMDERLTRREVADKIIAYLGV